MTLRTICSWASAASLPLRFRGRVALAPFVVSGTMSVVGCVRYLGDAVPASSEIRIAHSASGCFDQVSPTVRRTWSDEEPVPSAQEVAAAWDCSSRAIDAYLDNVRGDVRDGYKATEVRLFFERYIMGSSTVSDELFVQIMRFKRAVWGGSLDQVTRDELRRAQASIAALKEESLKLLPYVRLLMLSDHPERVYPQLADGNSAAAADFVEAAAQQTLASAAAVGRAFAGSGGTYSLQEARDLARELATLHSGQWTEPEWVAEKIPALTALKAFFVAPGGSEIKSNEWSEVLENSGRLLAAYLRYRYLLKDGDPLTGRRLVSLRAAFDDLFAALGAAVRNKPEGFVSWPLIDEAVRVLYGLKALEMPLTQPTLLAVLRPLVERVFNWRQSVESGMRGLPLCSEEPGPSFAPRASARTGLRCEPLRGLTASAVEQMRRDFAGWADMQRLWDEVESLASPASGLGDGLAPAELESAWARTRSEHEDHRSEVASQLGMSSRADAARRSRSLVYSPTGTVEFGRGARALRVNRGSFTSLNWKRLIIRGAIRGFAADPIEARWKGLTREEFQGFFFAFRPVAVELKLVASNDERSWSSAYDESDVFMFASDANGSVGFDEGVDLISFAVSSSRITRVVYRDMRAACANFENDAFGLPMLDLACSKARLRTKFGDYYSALPEWPKLASKLSPERMAELVEDFMKGARQAGESTQHLESTFLDRTTMIMQYIESLFVRFDADGDGYLDDAEATAAFPLFRRLLAEAAGELVAPGAWYAGLVTSDSGLLAIFKYLLAYGERPDGKWLAAWRLGALSEKVRADRARLVKIVASMRSR